MHKYLNSMNLWSLLFPVHKVYYLAEVVIDGLLNQQQHTVVTGYACCIIDRTAIRHSRNSCHLSHIGLSWGPGYVLLVIRARKLFSISLGIDQVNQPALSMLLCNEFYHSAMLFLLWSEQINESWILQNSWASKEKICA